MDVAESTHESAKEVLVLDSSTFVEEIGLTSRDASAIKHYLYHRGTRLIVPQIVAKECERHLTNRAKGKRESVQHSIDWLSRFCGRVSGWKAPRDAQIEERARMLAQASQLGAVVAPESEVIRERAELRNRAERPPSHRTPEFEDCVIWEHCLELLAGHDVVLVSGDEDFLGHVRRDELHPQLRAEADAVGAGRILTFHRSIQSLLTDLRSEIPSIPNEVVIAFIYDAVAAEIQELEWNSGCRPMAAGEVRQTLLTTDQADVIEVRLEMDDQWESSDGDQVCDFHLRGSCHYSLADDRLSDLTVSSIRLLTTDPDGSVRATKGSYIGISAHAYAGPRPIEPKPEVLA